MHIYILIYKSSADRRLSWTRTATVPVPLNSMHLKPFLVCLHLAPSETHHGRRTNPTEPPRSVRRFMNKSYRPNPAGPR